MQFSQIRRRTRRLLAEHTAGFWNDSLDVDPAINRAYAKAQAAAAAIGRDEDFESAWQRDLTAGVSEYDRYSYEPVRQYLRLSSAAGEYVECNVLHEEQVSRDADGNWSRWPDYPNYAVIERGDKIVVIPEPTETVTNGLRVRTRAPLSLVADTDEPAFPEPLHELIAKGAAADLMSEQRTSDPKRQAEFRADFDEFFNLRDPRALIALQRVYGTSKRFIVSAVPQVVSGLGLERGFGWRRWYE